MKELEGGEGSGEVERLLWHGTESKSVANICSTEFNRSFAGEANGKSAVLYFLLLARGDLQQLFLSAMYSNVLLLMYF